MSKFFLQPISVPYTVGGGTSGTQPTFSGNPLFSGYYVKTGELVYFDVQVDFDNITGFGTGQYYVTLPFPAKYATMFRSGCLHHFENGDEIQYHISGHVNADSDELYLFTTDISGQRLYDFPFEQGVPATLTSADNFHVSGSYIC